MPAINFTVAVDRIEDGSKFLTLRRKRADKRDAAPVDSRTPLRLFTGLRTLRHRLVLETVSVLRCWVQFGEAGCVSYGDVVVRTGECGGQAYTLLTDWGNATGAERAALNDAFARADGFDTWADLWAYHQGNGLDDTGCVTRELIAWRPPRSAC